MEIPIYDLFATEQQQQQRQSISWGFSQKFVKNDSITALPRQLLFQPPTKQSFLWPEFVRFNGLILGTSAMNERTLVCLQKSFRKNFHFLHSYNVSCADSHFAKEKTKT